MLNLTYTQTLNKKRLSHARGPGDYQPSGRHYLVLLRIDRHLALRAYSQSLVRRGWPAVLLTRRGLVNSAANRRACAEKQACIPHRSCNVSHDTGTTGHLVKACSTCQLLRSVETFCFVPTALQLPARKPTKPRYRARPLKPVLLPHPDVQLERQARAWHVLSQGVSQVVIV